MMVPAGQLPGLHMTITKHRGGFVTSSATLEASGHSSHDAQVSMEFLIEKAEAFMAYQEDHEVTE